MKSIKKKAAAIFAAVVLAGGMGIATAPAASAFTGGEMDQACRLATYPESEGVQHSNLWTAYLMYPGQGVYGWRCYYNNAPWAFANNTKYPLYVQTLCNSIYGGTAKFTDQNDAYSWYCG